MQQINSSDLLGRVINETYRLDAVLGEGSMGVVYKAQDLALFRECAVKFLLPVEALDHFSYELFLQRFQREANLLKQLEHPNIINVFASGEYRSRYGRLPYLVMPYIAGPTLLGKMAQEGPLTLYRALTYMEQAAKALNYAHSQKVIHRDIKPNNFLIDENGELIVADFGIARVQGSTLTKKGEFWGTPEYAAPEVINGKNIDYRADIYSLGIVLFEMLEGYTPDRAGFHDIQSSSEINEIFHKATAQRPEQRYANAQDLVKDIRQATQRLHSARTEFKYSNPRLQATRPAHMPNAPQKRPFLRPSLLSVLSIIVVGLIVLTVGSLLLSNQPTNKPIVFTQGTTNNITAPTPDAIQQAKNTVMLYYTSWAKHDYAAAYALLDASYQAKNSYSSSLKDYQQTHQICLTIDGATTQADGTIKVTITDNAVEDLPTGPGTATNIYQGFFLAKHEAAGWKLTPELHLTSINGSCLHPLS